jgi:hypothetical protein
MGEYATHRGESIKIGTCESMYYLRADQARLVTPESGSVDPVRDAESIRFRFPFPGEDDVAPGQFEPYNRRIRIDGLQAPAELADDHYRVQFVAQSHGYNVCLPCPESGKAEHGLTVHRNGFPGAVFLAQQRLVNGQLLPILECNCGMAWRVPEEESAPLFEALQASSDAERRREEMSRRHWEDAPLPEDWQTFHDRLADRIRQGYDRERTAELFPGVVA